MVGELAARHALPKEIIDGVTERTGGVPLFIEEVTRLLLERGEQSGIQAIPPTLQQSLTARLDRLGHGARSGPDRRRDRTRLFLRAIARGSGNGRHGIADAAGTARRRRHPARRRDCRLNSRLSVQARADPGRGV